MTRIGLISDTHGFLDERVFDHFNNCDEVWHAGDFGGNVAERFQIFAEAIPAAKSFKGVFGNIDDQRIRHEFPEQLVFNCENVKVMIRHIGGSPPNYNPATRKELAFHKPKLFISGHSHILKVIYDEKIDCLHINPGAAGMQGWHKIRTIVRFAIDGSDIKNCEVIELGKR